MVKQWLHPARAACVIGVAWGLATPAHAIYSAKEIFDVHQGSFDVATDLHIKFWQKEDDIEVLDWRIGELFGGLPAPDNVGRGDQPEPWHSRQNGGDTGPDNGMHAVDIDWLSLQIPFCTTVGLEFEWDLTEKNTKRVEVLWTKDGEPPDKPVPNHGWSVGDPEDIGGGLWKHGVEICNDEDPDDPLAEDLHLTNIMYSYADHYNPLSADELRNWDPWFDAPITDIVLAPGQCMMFDVITDFGDFGHILGSYQVIDTLGPLGGRQVQVFEVFDHPTPPLPSTGLSLLVVAAAARRRR
jgi:hypothetical protein